VEIAMWPVGIWQEVSKAREELDDAEGLARADAGLEPHPHLDGCERTVERDQKKAHRCWLANSEYGPE
jgi:hypothetical protein